MTILRISREERKRIQDAKDKSGIWYTAKSFISDGFFFNKGGTLQY